MANDFAPDYVDVAERLRLLREKHPDASLQGSYEVCDLNGTTHIIYRAECYRTPDDPRPGVGYAFEQVPGRTPYTRGSELMNAETSAWGRAIVAAGAAVSKRVASADEMHAAAPQPVPEGFATHEAAKARYDDLKGRIALAGLQEWVRDNFDWPWSAAACDEIAEKLADVSEPF